MSQIKFQGFSAGRQIDNNDPSIHIGGLFSLIDGKISIEGDAKSGEKYAASLSFLSNKSDCSDVVVALTNFKTINIEVRKEEMYHREGEYVCEYTIYNVDYSDIDNLANELSFFYDIV